MSVWLQNLKLKKKISLLIVVVVLSYMFLELWNQKNVYHSYNEQLYEQNAQLITTYMNYMEDLFARMEKVTFLLFEDRDLQEEILNLQGVQGIYEANEKRRDINSRLLNYVEWEPYYKGLVFLTESDIFQFGSAFTHTEEELWEYAEVVKGAKGATRFISQDRRLIMVREIRETKELRLRTVGYVVAWVDFQAMLQDMKEKIYTSESQIDLAVYDGDICLYTNYQPLEGYRVHENGWYLEGDDFVTVYTSPQTGYTMMIRTDYGEIRSTVQSARWSSVLWLILISSSVLAVGTGFAGYIVRDLETLTQRMDAFGQGRLVTHEEECRYAKRGDEVGRLYRHFFKMTKDYKKLTEEYYDNQMLLKEAEFSYLQKQIQPHFLYNTLSAIRWMAVANKDMSTANMLKVLGRMMRMITDNRELLITVDNELQIVEDYLTIQRFRFKHRLDAQVNISENTKKLRIPKLTLQPLVENSIIYGMDELEDICRIRIYEQVTEEWTELIVEDSGPGFSEDWLKNVAPVNGKESEENRERSQEEVHEGIGVGLGNIHLRLRYAFPEGGGLVFRRLENGMQVIVRIRNLT